MARLTDNDKKALLDFTRKGWKQSVVERSPIFVDPTPETNEKYCKWVSQLSTLTSSVRPVQFAGSNWKL
jgi:hypothetical protein